MSNSQKDKTCSISTWKNTGLFDMYLVEELMLSNFGGGDFWGSLGLQGVQASQSKRKPTLNPHWKDWCSIGSSDALAIWWEEAIHWKRPWCWERLRAGSEGGDRGLDIWMASLTQWTWIWANCGRLWRTAMSGGLQSMESQRVQYGLATKQ